MIKGTFYLKDLAENFLVKSIKLSDSGRGVRLRYTPIQEVQEAMTSCEYICTRRQRGQGLMIGPINAIAGSIVDLQVGRS